MRVSRTLTPSLRAKLAQLRQDRELKELLESLELSQVPPYRPSKVAGIEQHERWIYASGRNQGNQEIIDFLTVRTSEDE